MGVCSRGKYMPVMVMVALQFVYAGVALSSRTALLQGISPRVFVVYRQAIATLFLAPVAYFTRKGTSKCALGLKSFSLMFMVSLVGVTMNQNAFFEGLYMASSSIASAMGNLVPAVTFLMAAIVGLEKVQIRSLRSIAKIIGTVVCVTGAVAMALLKGPKLLNAESQPLNSVFGSGGDETWLLGCLLLFGSACCWSFWLISQVAVSASYPDHLSLSAWMCFFGALQSGIVAILVERDLNAWRLNSYLQLASCLFAGIMGSGVAFFAQSWCISKRGPLFSAMFNPLNTVIVTIFASIFLQEEIYTGSLVGAFAVVMGLYVVLWGKAKDNIQEMDIIEETDDPKSKNNEYSDVIIVLKRCEEAILDNAGCAVDLEQPLLSKTTVSTE